MEINNVTDKFIGKTMKKLILGLVILFFLFILFFAILYVAIRNLNTSQSIYDNIGNEKNEIEEVLNAFQLKAAGSEDEELYYFLNELASKYNGYFVEDKQRDSNFDLPLIMATLHYEKLFEAEVYQMGTLNSSTLTNREISNFLDTPIETKNEYKMFYKWAYLMLGTPYSIPNINLRGLTGNLISSKVVSKCVSPDEVIKTEKNDRGEIAVIGDVTSSKEQDVLEMIIDSELLFTGKDPSEKTSKSGCSGDYKVEKTNIFTGFWGWFKGLFDKNSSSVDKNADILRNAHSCQIREKVDKAYKKKGTDESEAVFINFDEYNPDLKCGGGETVVHRYVHTMHYEQYKEYLRNIFIPQNFLDCEKCYYKNATEELRHKVTENMIAEIFATAEAYYYYADIEAVDYNKASKNTSSTPSSLLANTISPLSGASCTITSPYTSLRGNYSHYAIDNIITGNPNEIIGTDPVGQTITGDSLLAPADGIVKEFKVLTDRQLTYVESEGTCIEDMSLNPGIYVILEYTVDGKRYQSGYYHLKAGSVTVKQGDKVVKGQKIAEIGTTGCSTGNHLHYEIIDLETGQNVNPTSLFSNCANYEEVEEENYLPTTDDFYADVMITVTSFKGSHSGTFPLEEYITGVVKAELGRVAGQSQEKINSLKEAIKAQAVAARTYAMKITDWGKNPIQNSSNNQNMDLVDIKGNASDKWIYEIVLETQGMVMTQTSDIFMSEYMNWPCQRVKEEELTLNDLNDEQRLILISYILSLGREEPHISEEAILKPEDFPSKYEERFWYTDEYGVSHFNEALYKSVTIDPINEELKNAYSYMAKSCSWYYNGNENASIETPLFYAIEYEGLSVSMLGVKLKYLPWGAEHYFEIPMGYIKEQYFGHNRGMTQLGALYLNEEGYKFADILNTFYESKAGKTDLLTAPGLVRIFMDEKELINKSFTFFEYGYELPGADNWHPCRVEQSYDDMLAEELDKYEDQAEMNAIMRGDINPMRVKVVAAAYWLAYNQYFKVQYDLSGDYSKEGIKNIWGCETTPPIELQNPPSELTEGLDCNGFVRWAFAQVGKDDIALGTNDGPRRIEVHGDTGLTVGQIASVAQLGDVLIKSASEHGDEYGHVALVFSVDRNAGTFSVIHASGYGPNITITEYKNSGKKTEYNWVLSMSKVYDDDAWEDSKGE